VIQTGPLCPPIPRERFASWCCAPCQDSKERLRDIGDARIEIEQIIRAPTQDLDADVAMHQARTWRRRARLALAVATAAAVIAAGVLGLMLLRGSGVTGDSRITRFTVELPKDSLMIPTMNSSLALSPDGRFLALTPLFGPVYIRRLDGLDNRPLDEVHGERDFRGAPVFSPDSAFLSFIDGNGIISKNRTFLKVAVSNGAATRWPTTTISMAETGPQTAGLLYRQLSRRHRPHPRLAAQSSRSRSSMSGAANGAIASRTCSPETTRSSSRWPRRDCQL
jgi:hypothetical protein